MNDRGRLDEKFSRFLHTSLDGIVEGPNGAMDIGFVHYNVELEQFAKQVTANADTILWGRATYEMMYQYWPNMLNNEEASEHERAHAAWIDAVEKLFVQEHYKRLHGIIQHRFMNRLLKNSTFENRKC